MMPRRQRGMALVIVLWLVVLLGVMAAGHARNAHTDTRLATRQLEMAKARAIAEAGVNRLILELLADEAVTPIRADGTVFALDVDGHPVTLALRNATGLVDLNAANSDLLAATLAACGVAEEARAVLVDAIEDWRDGDDLVRLNGIEDDGYAAIGLPWTSRDAPFATVEELRYVPGIGQELYRRIAPLVTVHSRRGGLNLEYAPPLMIAALTGNEIQPAADDEESADIRRTAGNGTYHIYASAPAGSGVVATIEAVVRISRASGHPVTVLEWRDPARVELPPWPGGGA